MKIKLISPKESKIYLVKVLERAIHYDPRGFLIETMRKDDKNIQGQKFAMSYTSMTLLGEARDETQWHHHKKQVDRFVCVKGRIALALYDNRKNSKSYGQLGVLDLEGAQDKEIDKIREENEKKDKTTYMVSVPEGVFHCYKNIGEEDCILVNFPTKLYNPNDEGRTLFSEVLMKSLSDNPFSWDIVKT